MMDNILSHAVILIVFVLSRHPMPPRSSCPQVPERTRRVLQAALDLSTSTKPFDSVTAAHLLTLLLHQQQLSAALHHCAQEQGLDFQPPTPLPEAPESLTLEINSLSGKLRSLQPCFCFCVGLTWTPGPTSS